MHGRARVLHEREPAWSERNSFRVRAPAAPPAPARAASLTPQRAQRGATGPGSPTRKAGSRRPHPLLPGLSSVPGTLKTLHVCQPPWAGTGLPERERSPDLRPHLSESRACPFALGPACCSGLGRRGPRLWARHGRSVH